MALGTCRHCGTRGIATDAPICRACGGWWPNPGLFTRLGVVTNRLVGLLFLVGGLGTTALALLALTSDKTVQAPVFGGLIFLAVLFALVGGVILFRSLARPYGRAPSDG